MAEGFVAPGFERVRDAFDAGLAEELGAGFAAVRDGEVVVNLWGGWADRERDAALGARHDRAGVFDHERRRARWCMALAGRSRRARLRRADATVWPAFGAHGKDKVTIAQTLAHQAGVPGFLEPIDPDLWLDPPACAAAIAALAPIWPPGSASGYHPMTWGYIAGELAQRASGRSLGTILREDICAPLGIDFQIGTPESEHHRARRDEEADARAAISAKSRRRAKPRSYTKWAAPTRGSTQWRKIEIPSANGHGTALAVARLYEAYATGGQISTATACSPKKHSTH